MSSSDFDYHEAFSRNIGWVSTSEQDRLRACRVAVAGMGGVGGSHLLSLARLGIGTFTIADFDRFELVNFNRQAGATVRSLGSHKGQVLAQMALDINPELVIRRYDQGVIADNADEFLDDVDLYVDGLDFFAFEARQMIFRRCRARGIPAITAAPLGLGVAFLYFAADGMSFDDYFGFADDDPVDNALRFLVGLSPAMLQRGYVVDGSRLDFEAQKGPSSIAACQLCSGVVCTEALKLLLGRGRVRAAPHGYQFDAYRARLVRTWRPGGNRNPIQRLTMMLARRQIDRLRVGGTRQPAKGDPPTVSGRQ